MTIKEYLPDNMERCLVTNCQNPAKITCSSCFSVKYCSNKCQRLDWYVSHINNCDRLKYIIEQERTQHFITRK